MIKGRVYGHHVERIEKMFDQLLRQVQKAQENEKPPSIIKWVEDNLWIVPKAGGLQKFILNAYQRNLFTYLQKCLDQQKPIRLVILKSRQLGISTAVGAFFMYLTHYYPLTNALVIAHRRDSARKLFQMVKRFYQHLPSWLRRSLHGGRPHKDDLEYSAPHSSHYHVLTAGAAEIGRGWTLQFVHASEVAFYMDPEGIMTALSQAVPKPSETSLSAFILESTANGQNLFKRYWDLAQDPHSDWTPLFYSWKDDPTCIIEKHPLYPNEFDKEELEYRQEYGLSDDQVRWARQIREDQCLNSWARFHQEYPVSPAVAFTSTGYPVFRQSVIQAMTEQLEANKPIFVGNIEFLASDQPHPLLIDVNNGPLKIWEHPDKTHEYMLGVDTAEGLGSDYSEIIVICKNPCKVVAHWRDNRIPPQEFGTKVWLLGQYYYWALAGVERNTVGQVVLGVMEHGHGDRAKFPNMVRYPHLYYETRTDQKNPTETERLGFQTSRKTKGTAIARLSELVGDGGIEIYSVPLLNQLRGFTWNPEHKRYSQTHKDELSELYNDDGVIALAIANEMRLHQFAQRFTPKALRGDF